MVFVFGGAVAAEDLTPQIVYTNETRTLDKEINGTKWEVEFVLNADACDLDDEWPCVEDWDFVRSVYCSDLDLRIPPWVPDCEEYNCMCCDVPGKQGVFGREAFSLMFYQNVGMQCGGGKPVIVEEFSWADFVTKVTIDPDCDYLSDPFRETADFDERCFDEGFWRDYFDTAPYPLCLPCDVEVLYCQYIDTQCVADDDDDDCGPPCPCYELNCDDDDDDCVEVVDCSWFHPDLEFTRENDGATRPTFSEVVYGGNLICGDSAHPRVIVDGPPFLDFYEAGESSFLTRFKWYDWDVTTCDECEGDGDVVLWKVRPPKCGCGDEKRDCSHEPDCIPICEEEPIFQFVRFFEMDLYNCDNITAIDLDFPVCCPCDPDAEWGIWKFVEVDECVETCVWEPLEVSYSESCETPLCGEEECECTLSTSFSGICGTDECNPGELCALEGEKFALGWFVPTIVDGVFGTTEYSVKAYACDPTELVKADLEELGVPDGASEDGIYFKMVFDPANADGICKVKLCMEPLQGGDFGLFYFDEDTGYWVAASEDDEGCFVFKGDLKALLGVTLGAGDPAEFPTAPVTDDDDDDDAAPVTDDDDDDAAPAPNPTDDDDSGLTSSSSGCNVGMGGAILFLLAPLGLLWFKKF